MIVINKLAMFSYSFNSKSVNMKRKYSAYYAYSLFIVTMFGALFPKLCKHVQKTRIKPGSLSVSERTKEIAP